MIGSALRTSLAARLVAFFAALSFVTFGAAAVWIDRVLTEEFVKRDTLELEGKAELALRLLDEFGLQRLQGTERHRLDDLVAGHPRLHVSFVGANGPVLQIGAPASTAELLTYANNAARGGGPMARLSAETPDRAWRYLVIAAPSVGPLQATKVVVASNAAEFAAMHAAIRRTLALAIAAAFLMFCAGGYAIARRGLRPVEAMAVTATAVSAERLGVRLATAAVPTELMPLATSFNAMLERLEDSFAKLAAFSADLAHELRTPLGNLILQNSVALERARAPREYQDVLESNLEELRRLARMTEQMLFLARSEHGLQAMQRQVLDLAAEVRSVAEFYEVVAEDRGMRIEVAGAAQASGDRDLLRQAIGNLLANAVRYGASGSTIRIGVAERSDTRRVVEVINEGPGIPAEHQGRVFERFYRADPARADSARGAGLGLAIVASIAKLHGGAAVVESRPQGPTTFRLILPA
jgi:two-component system, OmpR family, heavy metal sensor histidine kinase CusS